LITLDLHKEMGLFRSESCHELEITIYIVGLSAGSWLKKKGWSFKGGDRFVLAFSGKRSLFRRSDDTSQLNVINNRAYNHLTDQKRHQNGHDLFIPIFLPSKNRRSIRVRRCSRDPG